MTRRAAGPARQPFFLDRGGRRIFVLRFAAAHRSGRRPTVVFFAPFAEEMNRSRRMSTLLAEALAPAGTDLVVFDYGSTGESDGTFDGARWTDWVDDGAAVIAWSAAEADAPVAVVGLRLGAALALAAARASPERVSRAVLWQPVLAGSTYLTQFLRLRVAAALTGSGEKETTQGLRARIASGEALEIGGYAISPALADAIEAVTPAAAMPAENLPVDWMEIAGEGSALSPAGRRVIDSWRAGGVRVRETTATGELFWTTQDMTTAPNLVAATAARLAEPPS